MKRILSILCAAVLLTTILASCAANEPSSAEEMISASDLPPKVDLRNYGGKNYVTPVKKQMFGDCWTFSLAGSAEIAYLYANDLGVPAGEANNNVDFSEKYIAWYLYHGITKDDVVKGRIRASQVGEGFVPSEAENRDKNAVYNFGGEFVHYSNLFGSGFGPVDESAVINGEQPYKYGSSSSDDWSLPLNAEYRCADTNAFFRSSRVLPSPAAFDNNGGYVFDEDAINAIKSEIYKGHGVSLAFSTSGSFNQDHLAAYNSANNIADHAVTVVGYDDGFPKEYFSLESEKGSTPPEDGALIIKNSWGVTGDGENDIDDGYFYLSYYDHSIFSPMSYEFDSDKSVKHTELDYDQYDLMMTKWYGSKEYKIETKTANVFDAEADETLCQIEYITNAEKMEVSYEIYKDIEDDNPSSGSLLEKGVNRHLYAGVYKIDLKGGYALKKGEKYSVVLTMKRAGDGGEESVYTEVFPYSTEFSNGLKVRGVINKGESYLYTDGEWSDMSERRESLIESAYRQGIEEIGSRETMTNIKLESKDTFTIDNYPIKAILYPDKTE